MKIAFTRNSQIAEEEVGHVSVAHVLVWEETRVSHCKQYGTEGPLWLLWSLSWIL